MKLQIYDPEGTGVWINIDTASVTVNNNYQWSHTFEPPASGWEEGSYRVYIDGPASEGSSDEFGIVRI